MKSLPRLVVLLVILVILIAVAFELSQDRRSGTPVTLQDFINTITGVVRTPDGNPVAYASVGISKIPGQKVQELLETEHSLRFQTDERGRFEIAHKAQGPLYLQAWAKGYAPTSSGPVNAETKGIEIRLVPGIMVSGTVVTGAEKNQPVSDAGLFLTNVNTGITASGHADSNGRFSIGPLESGDYSVYIVHNTYVAADTRPISLTSDATDLIVPAMEGGTVRGRVRYEDTDNPIEGIMVNCTGAYGKKEIFTDADGYYELSGLPSGTLTVTLGSAGDRTKLSPALMMMTQLYDNPDGLAGFPGDNSRAMQECVVHAGHLTIVPDFLRMAGFFVRGVVVDPAGDVVPGATVLLECQRKVKQVSTASDGTFDVNLPPYFKELRLAAEVSGYDCPIVGPVTLDANTPQEFRLELCEDGSVEEQITDRSAQNLSQYPIPALLMMSDTKEPLTLDMLSGESKASDDSDNESSGADESSLDLRNVDFLSVPDDDTDVAKRPTPAPQPVISGLVTGKNGTPLPNADIKTFGMDGRRSNSTTTRNDGTYVIDTTAGVSYKVYAHQRGYYHPKPEIADAGDTGVDIALKPAATIQGQVVDLATGQIIENFGLSGIDGHFPVHTWQTQPYEAVSHENGIFTFDDIGSRECTLFFRAEGYHTVAILLQGLKAGDVRSDVKIVLEPITVLDGMF